MLGLHQSLKCSRYPIMRNNRFIDTSDRFLDIEGSNGLRD